ncbi:MAG: hypothetical protein E7556_07805 [Ruminococcaceae bacterium]|nr:hypothetical protein [Oscillospiraceae bacterium]
MKKCISLILAFVFVIGVFATAPLTPLANAASVGDLTFRLNESGTMYQVYECRTSASGSLTIPSIYNGLPVTQIYSYAFYECDNLTSVVIPDSVTTIGSSAFASCTSLASVTLGKGVTTIREGAFDSCYELTKVYITDLKSWCNIDFGDFGSNPLNNCADLYLNGTKITQLEIPQDVKKIKDFAFFGAAYLTNVTLPDSVESIGDYAFDICVSLKTINIPNNVETIGKGAFYNCSELTNLTIGDSVTDIGESAFLGCKSLSNVTIPASVTSIGEMAFYNCDSLKSVTLSNNVTYIGDYAFGCKYSLWEDTLIYIDGFVIYAPKGSTAEKYAKDNKITFSEIEVTDVHTHKYNEEVIKQPTCTEAGTKTFTCTTCGDSYTESITATGHKWNSGSVTLHPTCTTVGEKTYVCNVCYESKSETISVLGHNYAKDFTIDKNPTYDEAGSKSRHCTRCDAKTDITSIPELVRFSAPIITSITSEQNGIKFTWQKVNGTEGYIVFKLVQNEAGEYVYQQLAVVGPSTLAFTDWTAVDGETYCYAVAAMDEMGNAGQYSEFAHTYKKLTTLSTPKVSVKSTSSGVKVSWKAIENAETYTVYRRTYNAKTKKWGDWKKLKSGYTKTSFTDKKAKLGTKYRYTVKAVNGSVKSKYKSTDTIKYNVTPTVKVAKVSNGVKVTWSTAANATSYKIYRSTYNTKTKEWGSWKGIKTAKASSKSYTDKTAKKGVKYRYTVRAVNGSYKSTFKASGSVKR